MASIMDIMTGSYLSENVGLESSVSSRRRSRMFLVGCLHLLSIRAVDECCNDSGYDLVCENVHGPFALSDQGSQNASETADTIDIMKTKSTDRSSYMKGTWIPGRRQCSGFPTQALWSLRWRPARPPRQSGAQR